ncbi:uncharacterized protein AMSG_08246 [Thecamonas trahens ATCC 50062]|uniref:Uncharacterized protein n=1 Tax=Thecamonas trahens ATCC 50062 TaxID=461836 RepID=A0A0L0DHZ5_THETB|nr:hypothetical protein AMSG_08246 [Thecamonas trahens ATCC 50062]KNC51994.1 hypothetical protein AMSG_08246 [Thecamonas trahens ATCC 50062]|eukprot:XP_013755578.1 hypothetical protein AMSG_08246 [Thecamonas trahens ATCC 50062]
MHGRGRDEASYGQVSGARGNGRAYGAEPPQLAPPHPERAGGRWQSDASDGYYGPADGEAWEDEPLARPGERREPAYVLAAMQSEHSAAVAEAQGLAQANERLRGEIHALRLRVDEELERAAVIPRLEGQIKALNATVARLNEEAAAAASRDADADAARASLERKYYSATSELERARSRLAELEQKAAAAEAAETRHGRTQALVHELRAKVADNGSEIAELRARNAAAERAKEAAQREIQVLHGKVSDAQSRLDAALADVSHAHNHAASLEQALLTARLEADAKAARVEELEGLRGVLEDQVVSAENEKRAMRESYDAQLRAQAAQVLKLRHEAQVTADDSAASAATNAGAEQRMEASAGAEVYQLEAALRHKELELEQVIAMMRDLTHESKAQITALRNDNANLQSLLSATQAGARSPVRDSLSSPVRAKMEALGTSSMTALVESLVAENDSLATDLDAMQRVVANQKLRISMLMHSQQLDSERSMLAVGAVQQSPAKVMHG